ncbi:uncharacterized protein FIBRA_06146 [Fibroporia radiculosa]|uniref:Uncharacterized protein n=1 Tax=Fibroporia radiculosa TaxID=599839 RepID=J4GS93_9APHY|nr:uncharacterized protein FIBRA_06146 [Fibroporia radiculosa]CCM03990.1 predicted protein [Fibroporia radiculosa]
MADSDRLQSTLRQLEIALEFAQYSALTDADTLARLEEWKRRATAVLADLRVRPQPHLALSVQAQVVFSVAHFDGEGPWISEDAGRDAKGILQLYSAPEVSLLQEILSRHVKPVFHANPHPSLNPSTGRKLSRAAGGPLAHLDHLEGQTWKLHTGIVNTLSWCLRHSSSIVYEKLWHLIIPPVMTMLDDYEAPQKMHGIRLVTEMLQEVPADLLCRTGVDRLLSSSLKTCLTFLHSPETPSLIRAAVCTFVSLTLRTTPPGSEERFNQLCGILGDGIIGGVWIYAARDADAIEASVDVLPMAVQALGIGSVRYLKGIVPQLIYPLTPAPENVATKQLQFSSLRALAVVIRECAPRMHKWKGVILEGVLKCWVSLIDVGTSDKETLQLKDALKGIASSLLKACPSMAQVEYARLLEMDEQMFGPLVRLETA